MAQVESTAARRVIVPDLEGAPLRVLEMVEEVLLSVLPTGDPDLDFDPPVPLTRPDRALDAVRRVHGLVKPTQSGRSGEVPAAAAVRVFGPPRPESPARRWEHAPLAVVDVTEGDVAVLQQFAHELGAAAGGGGDLADVLDEFGDQLTWPGTGTLHERTAVSRLELVSRFARTVGLLDLADDADSGLIRARLDEAGPGGDLDLDEGEDAAYERLADRLNGMWSLGSGIERFIY